MADQNHDEMAAALAAMAGGAVPSEHESPSSGIPSESTVFSSPPAEPPAAPSPAAPPADAPPARRAVSPMPVPPPSVSSSVSPPFTPPPPARIRPSQPTAATAGDTVPAAPRQRPAMPQRAAAPPAAAPVVASVPEDPAETLSHITEDDDMEAPAPDPSTLVRSRSVPKKTASPLYAKLKFRQTVIPLLLTNGVLLPAIGVWALMPGSPLHDGGLPLPIMLFAVGFIMLVTGILNALQVKTLLDKPM